MLHRRSKELRLDAGNKQLDRINIISYPLLLTMADDERGNFCSEKARTYLEIQNYTINEFFRIA